MTTTRLTYNWAYRFFLAMAGVLVLNCILFASPSFEPVFHPNLSVSPISGTIKIDGQVSDQGWLKASRIDNFVERYPGENVAPPVQTTVYVTYDDENLYVAYVCRDDPTQIRATMCQRDQFFDDDAACVQIDTYGTATWAYRFLVNPYGIQRDELWSSVGGSDLGFDVIWKSAAQVTDSGYQVEFAVPFASMRFPNREQQTWKMDFWRIHPREVFRQYSWAAYDRNEQCWPCQWGTVDGIRNVQPGKGFEVLPSFVANQSGGLAERSDPDSHFENGEVLGELALGGKYSISSDVTLEASYNPDFSQIESDAAQIDVNSTFALFYPERRPFFQEGSDIFRTIFNSFYTRTVNDPQYAVKLTGRMDKARFGFLSALDETTPYIIPLDQSSITLNGQKSYVNVFRGSYSFGDDSRAGFMINDRRQEGGGYGTVVGLDGDIRLSRNFSIDGQYLLTYTEEPDDHSHSSFFEGDVPAGWEDSVNYYLGDDRFDNDKHTLVFDGESYWGTALITQLVRSARSWNFILDYNQISPSYRTQIGYDPINNHRTASFSSFYQFYPRSDIFETITPQIYTSRRWGFGGDKRHEYNNVGLSGNLKYAQTGIAMSYSYNAESFRGIWFDDLWRTNFNIDSRFSSQFAGGLSFGLGHGIARMYRLKGKELSIGSYVSLKPIDRLIIEPNYRLFRSEHTKTGDMFFSQQIFRSRFQLQANRELSFRMIVQYNRVELYGNTYESWGFDPLLTYRISSFSVFYVGSTHDCNTYLREMADPVAPPQSIWKLTSQQFFMKFQYLFQI